MVMFIILTFLVGELDPREWDVDEVAEAVL